MSPDPLNSSVSSLSLGTPSTNASGAASVSGVSTHGLGERGVHDHRHVCRGDRGTTLCAASTSAASLTVTAPGQFAFGYGSYTPAASVGPTSFGFVVSQTKQAGATSYQGQLGLVTPGKWLFQANVTSFGRTSATQGLLGGTGTLYWWNPSLNRGRGGWQLAASGVAYKATANAATRTSPASFGITISYTRVAPAARLAAELLAHHPDQGSHHHRLSPDTAPAGARAQLRSAPLPAKLWSPPLRPSN